VAAGFPKKMRPILQVTCLHAAAYDTFGAAAGRLYCDRDAGRLSCRQDVPKSCIRIGSAGTAIGGLGAAQTEILQSKKESRTKTNAHTNKS
jgi:hypothetical protein